jgi:SAM-dependent methyltransferase
MEIGCYFPHTIISLLNPSQYDYAYIGVDITRDALLAANKHVPEGMFVRCSLTSFPFKDESFDVILSLGVIHHLPEGTKNIGELSKSLKPAGLFALSEAVERKTLGFLGRFRGEFDSPHESKLKPQMLVNACTKSGRILHFFKNNSVVLGLFTSLIDLFPILQENKTYLKFITLMDQTAIKTLSHISSMFDAGAYFIIFRKV